MSNGHGGTGCAAATLEPRQTAGEVWADGERTGKVWFAAKGDFEMSYKKKGIGDRLLLKYFKSLLFYYAPLQSWPRH